MRVSTTLAGKRAHQAAAAGNYENNETSAQKAVTARSAGKESVHKIHKNFGIGYFYDITVCLNQLQLIFGNAADVH